MLGAIAGDIIGSKYEYSNINKKDFPLFSRGCSFTDDSVMTLAVASACMNCRRDPNNLKKQLVREMRRLGRLYPDRGYGGAFAAWLHSDDPKPYNSFGNGSAMRVSPVAYIAGSLKEAEELAAASAAVTHSHPEGIKGAQAVAGTVYLALNGCEKSEIKKYVELRYYSLNFTIDAIRESYRFDSSCQGSVPQALEVFFEEDGFERAVRTAVSLGGDSDTIAAIAGAAAYAYYGIPSAVAERAIGYIAPEATLFKIYMEFSEKYMTPYQI